MDQEYPGGIICFNPNEKAPDFVLGTLAITIDDFNKWCDENKDLQRSFNGKQQIKIQILKGRKNLYAKVDKFKKPK